MQYLKEPMLSNKEAKDNPRNLNKNFNAFIL